MTCPECGAQLIHTGGCTHCRECGWSQCGKTKVSHQGTKSTEKKP